MDAPDLGGSKPLLFLSHAGADIEAARRLKARLEAAPDARAAGLRVWFDKDNLSAGAPWMEQLKEGAWASQCSPTNHLFEFLDAHRFKVEEESIQPPRSALAELDDSYCLCEYLCRFRSKRIRSRGRVFDKGPG
jgi:hypothetical protein